MSVLPFTLILLCQCHRRTIVPLQLAVLFLNYLVFEWIIHWFIKTVICRYSSSTELVCTTSCPKTGQCNNLRFQSGMDNGWGSWLGLSSGTDNTHTQIYTKLSLLSSAYSLPVNSLTKLLPTRVRVDVVILLKGILWN